MFSFNFARPLGSLFLRSEGGIAGKGKFPPAKRNSKAAPAPFSERVHCSRDERKKYEEEEEEERVCSVKRVARSSSQSAENFF